MVSTPSSSSSSSFTSIGSFDDTSKPSTAVSPPIKFLCSYGGKILPRYPDGKLRYVGGDTRVLSVQRSILFSDLQEKLREMCGFGGAMGVRCQLPTLDLDALVSVKSDEDLTNVVAEYDAAGRDKIRVFLFPAATAKPSSKSSSGQGVSPTRPIAAAQPFARQASAPARLTGRVEKAGAALDVRYHGHHHLHGHPVATRSSNHLVHHGNHWP
ncbi:RAF-like serine/threonine-protein kinase 20 [Curcuma longa]|uniref:RAF-like serine/threonine-protein kinase 20 n=1 Tax=Curcuma longa TaxID=136217 RepID=UPI003D9EA949